MYIPPAFAVEDGAAIERIMAADPFALLITNDADGVPFASHLPLLFAPDGGPKGAIQGHMARANPHVALLRAGQQSLVVFSGPHAYVSPTWYAPGSNVPTWNYLAVHVYGTARLVEEPEAVRRHMKHLIGNFETGADAWRLDTQPARYVDGMLKGIVAFEIAIERIEAKAKLSQNRKPEDHDRARDRLAQGSEAEQAVARWMEK